MKKFLLILTTLILIQPAFAKNIKVEVLSDFSTAKPPKTWQVKILDGFVTDNGIKVVPNTILEGKIINVTSPKRLKRNASFNFVPKYYYSPEEGSAKTVKRDFVGKYSTTSDLDAKTIVKKGAMTAGNMLIGSFVAPTVGLVEGAVKNEKDNRVTSAVVSAYENTPLSLANKGEELEFKKGDVFIMNFKLKNEDDEENNKPNYSYEIVE